MTESFRPAVPTWELPASALRAPLPQEAAASAPNAEPPFPYDEESLCEALTPLISAAIARKARQRRFTP